MYLCMSLFSQGGVGGAGGTKGEGEAGQVPDRQEGLNNGSGKQFKSKVLNTVMYGPALRDGCWA
jgi:hypothetical protein